MTDGLGKKPVILLICPGGLHEGGMGRMMGYLIDALNASEHSYDLAIIDSRGPGSRYLSPFYLVAAVMRMTWHALTGNVRLVHVNVSERGSVWRKAVITTTAQVFRIPFILHMHGPQFVEFFEALSPFKQKLVRVVFQKAARTIVLGQYWKAYVIDRLWLEPNRIVVLFNAVPSMLGGACVRSNPARRLLFLGNLSDRKGIGELLCALAAPDNAAINWTLTVAGGGQVERFKTKCAELGLSRRVTFTGWVDRTTAVDLLISSDALILPSHNEGLPMVLLEALNCGLAVVTTPVGSIPEVVTSEFDALLVTPGDVVELANALHRLLTDGALMERLSTNAARAFGEQFAIDAFATTMLGIYEQSILSRETSADTSLVQK